MNPELTNNGLQPPDKPLRRADEDSIDGTIKWVREFFQPEDIFDLYHHDREVVIAFETWKRTSSRQTPNWEGRGKTPDQLWEIYCKEAKQ